VTGLVPARPNRIRDSQESAADIQLDRHAVQRGNDSLRAAQGYLSSGQPGEIVTFASLLNRVYVAVGEVPTETG